MINWLDALKRTAGSIGSSPMGLASRTAGSLFNAGKSILNNTQATPTSTMQTPVAPKTNNTPEIKGTTLSKPNFNPNANVLNQNLMTNYTQPQNNTIGGAGQMIKPQQPVDLPQMPQVSTPTPTVPTTPVESEADKFFKLYQQSFAMTPQEEALQTQLSNLTTGADLGVAWLEGQGRGIPLSLVRGQQEKLLKQAAIQTQPLQKQLELLQAKRQAQMEVAKAGMDYFKEESQAFSPMKVGAGETLIDPRTGQTIYQGQAEAPSIAEQYGSGIIGEYNFAKAQGYPGSFIDYQNEDANRKKSIAAGAVLDSSGMTSKQNQNFVAITNKFQADEIMKYANTSANTIALADKVIANPGNAANQLMALYSLVKGLDPDSAVREGELSLAQSTQSYLQKWGTTLQRVASGKIVSAETAKQLAQASKDLANQWYIAGQRREKQYGAQAQVAGIGNQFNEYLGMFDRPYIQSGSTSNNNNDPLGLR